MDMCVSVNWVLASVTDIDWTLCTCLTGTCSYFVIAASGTVCSPGDAPWTCFRTCFAAADVVEAVYCLFRSEAGVSQSLSPLEVR